MEEFLIGLELEFLLVVYVVPRFYVYLLIVLLA